MYEPVMRVGDARDLSGLGLQEESVDCIVTSPPYWDLKRYGDGDEREIGHGNSKHGYLSAVGQVFRECFRLARPTAVMWMVADTMRDSARRPGPGELIPLPFELAEEAREAGWRLQDVVIWEKNKTLPYSGQGKLRNLIEYVLFFTKGQEFKHRPYRFAERQRPGAEWLAGWPERYHPLGRRPANIWRIPIDTQGIWQHAERLHYCPFPQDLVARFIDLTTDKGDVVLDPFAGIGTVPAQAAAMGRRGYGVELNPTSADTFKARLLPAFQARWEAGATARAFAREDQLDEAQLILQLRLLKAGKELMRAVDHLRHGRASHPADLVEGVVAVEPAGLREYIDIDAGVVARPACVLALFGALDDDGAKRLRDELGPVMAGPPFSTFGLDIDISFVASAGEAAERFGDLREFGQSRQGAYTAKIEGQLFPSPPRLLTTVNLEMSVSGDRRSALDVARERAERKLLASELAKGLRHEEVAARLGIGRAELHRLLVAHGLLEQPRAFAIALPEQLALSSD